MPVFKGCHGHTSARGTIEYVTREDKAAFVDVINLVEDFDYAKQFDSTFVRFGKRTGPRDRRYYHFKLSPARGDEVTSETMRDYALSVTKELFPDFQCVVATHADTDTVHAHIVVNAVNVKTGRKLRIPDDTYAKMVRRVNGIGLDYGLTPSNFGEKAAGTRRTTAEMRIMKKGETCWKEDLRTKIRIAATKALSMEEFREILKKDGISVEMSSSGTDCLYFYPGAEYPCPGEKLGADYTLFGVSVAVFINKWEESMKEGSVKGEEYADT